jgi:transcriptional regulator with GAF, ATPase, and Fis domain
VAPDPSVRALPPGLGDACAAVARAIADSLEPREIIRRVADAARLVISFDAMGVWLAAGPDDPLSLIAGPGASSRVGPLNRPLRRSDHSTKLWPDGGALPVCIDDAPAELDPAYAGDWVVIELGFRSAMVLGLVSGARNLGILWFLKREPSSFAPSQAEALQPVVDLTTLAVEHTQLQSLSDERRRKREALEALLPTLAGTLDVQAVFAQVSEVIQSVIPHDHMTLGLVSSKGKGIRFHASSRGTISSRIPEYRPKTDYGAESLNWECFIVREYTRLPEGMLRVEFWDPRTRQMRVREYRPDPALYQSYEERGIRSELRMPIWLQGERVGYLFFFSRQANAFSEDDVDLARRVADHLALAIAHERLAAEAKRLTHAQEQASRLQERVDSLVEELKGIGPHRALGRSRKWRDVLGHATKVAQTDTTVLVTGESGTGKEVIARFIHRGSRRAERPFVAINCAALPEQLLESELFGHERGAFTGAHASRPGKVEQASGGILFLDEVAEMTPPVQAKFLRLLQEREFQRLGGTQTLRADVRVIAATNRDPRVAMERGTLREDLYYRLNVFEIALPPLRDRPDDILVLAEAFLDEIGRSVGRPAAGLSKDAQDRLLAHPWPGNIRELRNAVERAVILCEGGLITGEHLPIALTTAAKPAAGAVPAQPARAAAPAEPSRAIPPEGVNLEAIERDLIEKAMALAQNNKSVAAKLLGLPRGQLYSRLKRHGLDRGKG